VFSVLAAIILTVVVNLLPC